MTLRRRLLAVLALSTGLVGTVSLGTSAPAAAATVPAGFTDSAVPGGSFSSPTTVQWLPGDRLVVLEQSGAMRVSQAGGPWRTAIDLNVCSGSERGLLGVAGDPGMLANGWVYVYYTRPAGGTCVNRVSRFTMSGTEIVPGSEVVLLDNIASTGGNHNGGDLEVGSDGYLYVAIGDAGTDPRGNSGSGGRNDAAQDRSLLNGKIVRITRDGAPAPGNPFTGSGTAPCATAGTSAPAATVCQEIYALGLRNPYRIAFDRNGGTARFFINDVGQNTREEVNEGIAGANYGWPTYEGVCLQGSNPPCTAMAAGFTPPVTDYSHARGSYVTGGAFVPDGLWPAAYDGGYLFGDGGSGRIWLRSANGTVDYDAPFATDAGGLTDLTFGFDAATGRAALYYVRASGTLRVITPTASLAQPATDAMVLTPLATPQRAYDTGQGTGVAAGKVFNGATRLIDLPTPAGARAALVNLTIADTAGPGFLRSWVPRGARPGTSSVNADGAAAFVANAAVVPIDADGRFVLEAATTARVVVDLLGTFSASGPTAAGRFVALDPERVVDTRLAASGTNEFTRTGSRIDIAPFGANGAPADVGSVVLSIGAIAPPSAGGFVGAYPAGTPYGGTSNVNVVPGDVRANTVVVALGSDEMVSLATLNIDHVVVDLVGYFTDTDAASSSAGRFSFVPPQRLVDTRTSLGFGRLGALTPADVATGTSGSGVLQNVTVTGTSAAGWLATYPSGATTPGVSTVNFTAAGQSRAVLAFTKVATGRVAYEAFVPTDVVVDIIGTFS